jgi:competence protein ComEC
MPLEAAALFLEWAAGHALDGLLWLAHQVASARGAVATLPSIPAWAFGLMILGSLWLCIWTSRLRPLGMAPFAVGAVAASMSPAPDLFVTGDGRHLAIVSSDSMPMMLRDVAATSCET